MAMVNKKRQIFLEKRFFFLCEKHPQVDLSQVSTYFKPNIVRDPY